MVDEGKKVEWGADLQVRRVLRDLTKHNVLVLIQTNFKSKVLILCVADVNFYQTQDDSMR